MFNKVFVFSLIGAVTAELKDGLYRILDPEINSIGYVAKSGYHVGTPVTLSLSEPTDLHELIQKKKRGAGAARGICTISRKRIQCNNIAFFFCMTGRTETEPKKKLG